MDTPCYLEQEMTHSKVLSPSPASPTPHSHSHSHTHTHTSSTVWDIRQFREPVKAFLDLPSYGNSDCVFSPNDDFFVTGTGAKKEEGSGLLVFYSKATLEKTKQIGMNKFILFFSLSFLLTKIIQVWLQVLSHAFYGIPN